MDKKINHKIWYDKVECTNEFSKVVIGIDDAMYTWTASLVTKDAPQAYADRYNNGRPTAMKYLLVEQFLSMVAKRYYNEDINQSDSDELLRFLGMLSNDYGNDFVENILKIQNMLRKIEDNMENEAYPK